MVQKNDNNKKKNSNKKVISPQKHSKHSKDKKSHNNKKESKQTNNGKSKSKKSQEKNIKETKKKETKKEINKNIKKPINNKIQKQKGGFQDNDFQKESSQRPCDRRGAIRKCFTEKDDLSIFDGAPSIPPPPFLENADEDGCIIC